MRQLPLELTSLRFGSVIGTGFLSRETAREVWEHCNEKLRNDPGFSARGLILRSKVEMIGTTDDPCDSLVWHEKLAVDTDFPVKVCFRRVLCDLLGKWVENGEYPADISLLGGLPEEICYRNARRYFNL